METTTMSQPKIDTSKTPEGKNRTYDRDVAVGDKGIIHGAYKRGGKITEVPIIITHVADNYITFKSQDNSTFNGNKFDHVAKYRSKNDDVFVVITEKKSIPPPPAPIIKKEVIKEVHYEQQVYLPQFEETAIDRWYKRYCEGKGRMIDKKVLREIRIIDPETEEVIEVIDKDKDLVGSSD